MPDPKPPTMRAATNHERFMDSIQGYLDALRQQPVAQVTGAIGDVMDAGFRGNLGREDLHVGNVTIPAEAQKVAAMVYHGSPHKFTKFDMSKVGTGEGAQAYGHGLYFADSPGVAKSYAVAQEAPDVRMFGRSLGVPRWSADLSDQPWVIRALSDARSVDPSASVDELISHVAKRIETEGRGSGAALENLRQNRSDILRAMQERGVEVIPSTESLYSVDLPDEAIAKMIDWDAPYSQQPNSVKALFPLDENGRIALPNGERDVASKWRGESIYRAIAEGVGKPARASELLREKGIPGIQYYDGASRSAQSGSRNYVVFDDSLPTILKVNGKPVNPALEALKKAK